MQEESKTRFAVELESLKKSTRSISDALGVVFDTAWDAGAQEGAKATMRDIINYVLRLADQHQRNGDGSIAREFHRLHQALKSGDWVNDK